MLNHYSLFSNASKFDWAYPWLIQIFDWAPSQTSSFDWAQSLQVYYKDLIWTIPLTGPIKYLTEPVQLLTSAVNYLTGAVDVDLTGHLPVIWHLRPYLFLPRVAIITSILAIALVLFPTNSKAVTASSTTTTGATRLSPRPPLSPLFHLAGHVWTLHGLSLGPLGAPVLLAAMVTMHLALPCPIVIYLVVLPFLVILFYLFVYEYFVVTLYHNYYSDRYLNSNIINRI